MIGPYVNGLALVVGGVAGAMIGPRLGKDLRTNVSMVFGCASMGIGVVMIVKVHVLAPVVLALIVGTIVGELVRLEMLIQMAVQNVRGLLEKTSFGAGQSSQEDFFDKFIPLVVLFCFSGMGIYGALNEGMSADPQLLIVKAILDLFTAVIFASSLGIMVGILAVPQFLVQTALFLAATLIVPLTTPDMMADFSACGGMILLATGFRICGIKPFPVANMLPALVLVMPFSWAWAALVA